MGIIQEIQIVMGKFAIVADVGTGRALEQGKSGGVQLDGGSLTTGSRYQVPNTGGIAGDEFSDKVILSVKNWNVTDNS